ncbi:unnamed protein product, partial [Owenia fusiformis]
MMRLCGTILIVTFLSIKRSTQVNVTHYFEFDVQLHGDRASEGQGRVMIYREKNWQRICNYGWDINDAKVVCRQLGYDPDGTETQLYKSNRKKDRKNSIDKWGYVPTRRYGVHSVMCNGNESFIEQCKMTWQETQKCKEQQDAIAICKKYESDDGIRRTNDG